MSIALGPAPPAAPSKPLASPFSGASNGGGGDEGGGVAVASYWPACPEVATLTRALLQSSANQYEEHLVVDMGGAALAPGAIVAAWAALVATLAGAGRYDAHALVCDPADPPDLDQTRRIARCDDHRRPDRDDDDDDDRPVLLICCRIEHLTRTAAIVLCEAMRNRALHVQGRRLDRPFTLVAVRTGPAPALTPDLRDRFAQEMLCSGAQWQAVQALVRSDASMRPPAGAVVASALEGVYVCNSVLQYVRDIVQCVRSYPGLNGQTVSSRAMRSIVQASQAQALLSGIAFVRPVDVDLVVVDCLAHRLDLPAGTTGHQAKAQQGPTVPPTIRSYLHDVIFQQVIPPR